MKIPKILLIPKIEDENNSFKLGFKYASPEIGKRFFLGGDPSWIQEEVDITCDECQKPMTFYGQLDSINDDIIIGDCGLIYVFICFECLTSKSIVQSY